MRLFKTVLLASAAALVMAAGAVQAAPLVANGGFDAGPASSTEFGPNYLGGAVTVPNWTTTNLGGGGAYNLFFNASDFHSDIRFSTRFSGEAQQLPSNVTVDPFGAGGNFVFLDGDSQYNGPLFQTMTGLNVGSSYKLTFDWAAVQLTNRTGPITEQFQVDFGGDVQTTGVISGVDNAPPTSNGFSGWQTATLFFTSNNASQVLSFLSLGTPNGLPPGALLDNVVLTEVPEPASLALLGAGLVGLGLTRRRKGRAEA